MLQKYPYFEFCWIKITLPNNLGVAINWIVYVVNDDEKITVKVDYMKCLAPSGTALNVICAKTHMRKLELHEHIESYHMIILRLCI